MTTCKHNQHPLTCLQCHEESKRRVGMSEQQTEAKRNSVKYRYDVIAATFLQAMASIGRHGADKYGDYNWHASRLTGDKLPVNHIYKHLISYQMGETYDHADVGIERKYHLAAIAFNAMMEWWYEENIPDDKSVSTFPYKNAYGMMIRNQREQYQSSLNDYKPACECHPKHEHCICGCHGTGNAMIPCGHCTGKRCEGLYY